MKSNVISFPHIGNYYIPIYNLFNNLIDKNTTEILIPKKNSVRSLEIGSQNSPEFICTPFKYNMGNYIESLEAGANILIQIGGGCKYGYYSEVQEQILKDMGYKFTFITLSDPQGIDILKIYKKVKPLNRKLSFTAFVSRFLLTIKMIEFMDDLETYVRENILYEVNKGELEKIHKEFLVELKNIKNKEHFIKIRKIYKEKLKNVELNKKKDFLRVGLIGELYSLMEPFASFFMEENLTKMGIQLKRYTTVTYLLFKKGKSEGQVLNEAKDYIKYTLGADGAESVAHAVTLAKEGYDGLIHLKPFGCTPEINAMPILQRVSNDYNIPIMYLTFDSQTSREGILTRIEAFADMIKMKKEKCNNMKRGVV